jgi:glutamate--cysteine ligase
MSTTLNNNLQLLQSHPALLKSLCTLYRGIERESLRVAPNGKLALSPHPDTLGSTLCHPKITTDYAEALLELITPVHSTISGCLEELEDIHQFVYAELTKQDEMLWSSSMPCQLGKADDIQIAQYGSSNIAKMKMVYREGLGHRYGKVMQTISGIHYNFSLSDKFWRGYQQALNDTGTIDAFKTTHYFRLIRNFRRNAPLLVYLFGASPAVCRSFLQGQQHNLTPFDEHSWHGEYATSLRMSDLGYQSSAQNALFVCYNNIDNYINTLRQAITVPHPEYAAIGVKNSDGEYLQLNTSLLQIENEFYSTIRPKRITASGEAPINALKRGGVEYIEVRCIDINPFTPLGIDDDTMRFLDLFLLYCLFADSPDFDDTECQSVSKNLAAVVNYGRSPNCELTINGLKLPFNQWANNQLSNIFDLAKALDSLHANNIYQDCWRLQHKKIADVSLTPSAQVLATMRDKKITFAEFSRQQSQQWQSYFLHKPLTHNKRVAFEELAADSLVQQKTIESAVTLSFEEYLKNFYQQYYSEQP